MFKSFLSLSIFVLGFAALGADLGLDITPNLGQPATDYIAIVSPDGSGLPEGEGSVGEGRTVYEARCAACHGIDGKLPGNQLVGGRGSIKSPRPLKTVGSYWPYATTLFDYISMSMPYNEEKTMTASEIYAVTAYVLYMNDIVAPDTSLNRSNLPDVQMPNRDGFIELLD